MLQDWDENLDLQLGFFPSFFPSKSFCEDCEKINWSIHRYSCFIKSIFNQPQKWNVIHPPKTELTVQENVQGWQPTQGVNTFHLLQRALSSWKSPPLTWPNLKKNIPKSQPDLESRHRGSDEGDDFWGRKVKQVYLSCHIISSCTLLKQQLTLDAWKGKAGFVPCLPSPGRCHSNTKVSEDFGCNSSRRRSRGENLSRN